MFDNKAFEKAWINACVHNLWYTHISPQIYIFDDRMEIESHGGRGAHHFAKLNFSFILSIRKCKNNNLSKNWS